MKRISIICLLATFMSCSYLNQECSIIIYSEDMDTSNFNILSDSIIQIHLTKNVSFNWDKRNYQIIEDTLFNYANFNYKSVRNEVIAKILDESITPTKMCYVERNLLIGDFAFIFIFKVEELPIFELFQIQWDYFELNCIYPYGLIDYVKNHRTKVKEKIEFYVLSNSY